MQSCTIKLSNSDTNVCYNGSSVSIMSYFKTSYALNDVTNHSKIHHVGFQFFSISILKHRRKYSDAKTIKMLGDTTRLSVVRCPTAMPCL